MISFIIPAKNEVENLNHVLPALQSAADSWGGEYEIILVDNGSTDGTSVLATEAGCKVLAVEEGTIAHLRNVGAGSSTGDILCFLDADCIVPPDWVASCLEQFDFDTELLIVGAPAIADFDKGTWVEKSISMIMAAAPRSDRPAWIGTSNLFVRKPDFEQVGGFNESMVTGEDFDFCKRLNESGKCICLDKTVPVIHLGESKTLYQYLKKEYWRGSGSKLEGFTSFIKDRYNIFMLGCLLMFFMAVGAAMTGSGLFFFFAFALFFMPVVYMCIKIKTVPKKCYFLKLYAVSSVYLVARCASLLRNLVVKCCPFT